MPESAPAPAPSAPGTATPSGGQAAPQTPAQQTAFDAGSWWSNASRSFGEVNDPEAPKMPDYQDGMDLKTYHDGMRKYNEGLENHRAELSRAQQLRDYRREATEVFQKGIIHGEGENALMLKLESEQQAQRLLDGLRKGGTISPKDHAKLLLMDDLIRQAEERGARKAMGGQQRPPAQQAQPQRPGSPAQTVTVPDVGATRKGGPKPTGIMEILGEMGFSDKDIRNNPGVLFEPVGDRQVPTR